jgi:hypothetical protein
LRSRLIFTVSGVNIEDIERKSVLIVSEYLGSDDLERVKRETDFEVEVTAEVENFIEETLSYPIVKTFTAKVWAKIK